MSGKRENPSSTRAGGRESLRCSNGKRAGKFGVEVASRLESDEDLETDFVRLFDLSKNKKQENPLKSKMTFHDCEMRRDEEIGFEGNHAGSRRLAPLRSTFQPSCRLM